MATYTKQVGGGNWLKAEKVPDGVQAYLVDETNPSTTTIKGKEVNRDVSKIKIKGFEEVFNINLNKTTINGLVDAFGGDSKNWIKKIVTIKKRETNVGGREFEVLYLIPEGYELTKDENKYLVITKKDELTLPTLDELDAKESSEHPF